MARVEDDTTHSCVVAGFHDMAREAGRAAAAAATFIAKRWNRARPGAGRASEDDKE
jgi:hypothetical protein